MRFLYSSRSNGHNVNNSEYNCYSKLSSNGINCCFINQLGGLVMLQKEKVIYNLIGRFQIAHVVHAQLFQHAIDNADHVIIQIGSSDILPDPKNPFTFAERKQVIEAIIEPMLAEHREHGRSKKVSILALHDYVYDNNKWLREVQLNVSSVTTSTDITLTGSEKDDSSYYLQMFPQWKTDFIEVVPLVGATSVRRQFFDSATIQRGLPNPTAEFLSKFLRKNKGETFLKLQAEYNFNISYKNKFKPLPYTIPFVTGDAVVVCAGHILLIERGALPGKGAWALPGGFFQTGLTLDKETDEFVVSEKVDSDAIETAIRELHEETRLKVAKGVLRGAIRDSKVFADPNRSLRWRIITHATHIQLNDTVLPKVKGADDAKKAFWVPIGDLVGNRDRFFEDHLSIIDTYLNVL